MVWHRCRGGHWAFYIVIKIRSFARRTSSRNLNFQGNGKQNVTVHGEKGADYQKRTKRGRTIKADSSDEKRGTAAFENDELLFWSGEAPGGWNDKRGSG